MAAQHSSLEEEIFGPYWQKAMCRTEQVITYFERRFGLRRSAYYDILAPRLPQTSLAGDDHTGRMVGQGMFCIQVVEECDKLQEEAMARAKRPGKPARLDRAPEEPGRSEAEGSPWQEEV